MRMLSVEEVGATVPPPPPVLRATSAEVKAGECEVDRYATPPKGRIRQVADSISAEVLYGYPYLWDAIKQVDMGARGDLRNDSAELGMERKLRAHQVGKDDTLAACIAPHQGGGRLIAARLDAEDDEVAWVWGSSHDASLQGKTGTIEEYDAFLSI